MEERVLNLILAILAGLSTAIPLVVNLVKYVQKSVQERNWDKLLSMVIRLMEEAETKFASGADKKQWVLAMVKASADTINYEVDLAVIDQLIESLCDMTHVVNPPIPTKAGE